jgi:hypothetical protein
MVSLYRRKRGAEKARKKKVEKEGKWEITFFSIF